MPPPQRTPESQAESRTKLRTGKLAPRLLRRLVLGRLGVRQPEVLVHAAFGEDAAAIGVGREAVVLTADPITGATRHAGWYAVHIACNDVAAMGARPIGVLATILLPETADEADVEAVTGDVDRACCELTIEVLGWSYRGSGRPPVSADRDDRGWPSSTRSFAGLRRSQSWA